MISNALQQQTVIGIRNLERLSLGNDLCLNLPQNPHVLGQICLIVSNQ